MSLEVYTFKAMLFDNLGGNEKMKTNKKQLKELATMLNAYYCGGNVYNHENIREYISNTNYDIQELNKYTNRNNNVYELIERLQKAIGNKKYNVTSRLIAYSANVYGNSGQIFQYELYDINGVFDTIYTYYC